MKSASLADRLQYAAMRTAIAGLGALSWERAAEVGARLGSLGYAPFKIRRDVVERQIAAAFPKWPRGEVVRVARAAYQHLGRVSVETALLSRLPRERVLELVEGVDGWDVLERALARGRGAILLTAHFGNWELAGAYLVARGLTLDAVARKMNNPLFDSYITRTRERLGIAIVYDKDAVRRTAKAVQEGRAVAFLADQGALNMASTWVPFFGRLAKTPRGPAVLALRWDVPVIFGVAMRLPDGRYRLGIEEIPFDKSDDRDADVDRIVARYTASLERWVRREPEQYFWHHRRWKHQQPGTPPELGDPSVAP
ncbi:MAG: lysophospholipid acyltransferase family protein [Gemmatimonadota bacterium]|nr:lysophospholipid acyltransferase family protein [Gemmatimonadota bacterium]